MPRQYNSLNKLKNSNRGDKICSYCTVQNDGSLRVCQIHRSDLSTKINEMVLLCPNFSELVDLILQIGYAENKCNKSDLCLLIHKINKRWSVGGKVETNYNPTQSLKQYCRMKYAELGDTISKPPNNSAPKSEFQQWALENGISLDGFNQRHYEQISTMEDIMSASAYTTMLRQNHHIAPSESVIARDIPQVLPKAIFSNRPQPRKEEKKFSIASLLN